MDATWNVHAFGGIRSAFKQIHLTCLAHGIHRVAENIREKFKKVDKLISRVKQVFLKAPSRVLVFNSEAPAIPLPPEPILTRWGTWIIAASYYCKYYQVIRRVLLSLNAEDAISVKEAQQLIQEPDMEANLVYIHSNFGFIPEYITKLETQYISLSEALSAVKYVQNKLNDCEGEIGVAVFQKLNNVLEKNCDFKTVLKISKILSGQESSMEGLPDDLTVTESEDYAYILFCLYIKNMSSLSRSSKKGRIREKLEEFLKQDQFIFNQLEFEEHDDEAVGVVDKNNAGCQFIVDEKNATEESDTDCSDEEPPFRHYTEVDSDSVKTKLALWNIKHNITHAATSNTCYNYLLKIIQSSYDPSLPGDSRSLLKTKISSIKIPLKEIATEQYYHSGVRNGIIQNYIDDTMDVIKLVVGIDGLPLAKSSKSTFWPILCYIRPYIIMYFQLGYIGEMKNQIF
ncbi:hypothetical protein QTP88_027959 [Uroleucon formosanum]